MELAEWQEMCLVLPWQCDQMNRCKGFQGTCGCRWSRLCVPHQTGTEVSVSLPAWRRSVPCRCWPQPTPHSRCSSWTVSRSSAGNGGGSFDHKRDTKVNSWHCGRMFVFTRILFKFLPALRSYTATVQSLLPEMMYLSSAARHITMFPWYRRLFTSGSAAVDNKKKHDYKHHKQLHLILYTHQGHLFFFTPTTASMYFISEI